MLSRHGSLWSETKAVSQCDVVRAADVCARSHGIHDSLRSCADFDRFLDLSFPKIRSGRIRAVRENQIIIPCPSRKSYPRVAMMQSGQDWPGRPRDFQRQWLETLRDATAESCQAERCGPNRADLARAKSSTPIPPGHSHEAGRRCGALLRDRKSVV